MQIEQADKGVLQLEESIALQRTGWKIQAFMKVFILALLVCGTLGIFGSGELSKAEYQTDNLKVVYERYARVGAEQVALIKGTENVRLIGMDAASGPAYTFVNIHPHPDTVFTKMGRVQYVFTGKVKQVSLRLKVDEAGRNTLALYVNERFLSLPQFIYP
ncbi:MAG: hypothetical protein ACO1NW_19595 [Chitinophagaceae bacterium]